MVFANLLLAVEFLSFGAFCCGHAIVGPTRLAIHSAVRLGLLDLAA